MHKRGRTRQKRSIKPQAAAAQASSGGRKPSLFLLKAGR